MRKFHVLQGTLMVLLISVLAAAVILAVNPARQIADANNEKRRQDVNVIASALAEYALDHADAFPVALSSSAREICGKSEAQKACLSGVDVSALVRGSYLSFVPADPLTPPGATGTGYAVRRGASVRPSVIVSAPRAELGETIEAVR